VWLASFSGGFTIDPKNRIPKGLVVACCILPPLVCHHLETNYSDLCKLVCIKNYAVPALCNQSSESLGVFLVKNGRKLANFEKVAWEDQPS
jgi:hypothetical protein